MRRPSKGRATLYWRLLPSYLVLLVVGSVTTFLVAEAIAPLFLERHVGVMQASMAEFEGIDMTEMETDLAVSYRDAITQSLVWAILVGAVAAGGVSLFVSRRIVRPLRAMTRASRRIADGYYAGRLDPSAPGEIGDLADAFNVMASTLERSEERRVILLADVAHELRTPLSNLQGYLEGLEDGVFAPTEVATLAGRQVARLERLTRDLSILSKVETGQISLDAKSVATDAVLARTADAFRTPASDRNVDLCVESAAKPLWIRADPERLSQVIDNLVANALRHTPSGGQVTVACVGRRDGQIRFEVRDTGEGISAEHLPYIFNRFYRVDPARGRSGGGGSGIGLTLVKQLMERMGGSVDVVSEPGVGSTFGLSLPEAPAHAKEPTFEAASRTENDPAGVAPTGEGATSR